MKKALVLGAGNWQRSAINKMIKDKYKVYLIDNRPDVLQNFRKIKTNLIDYKKVNKVLKLAKNEGIKKCVTFASDPTLRQSNIINKKLKNFYIENSNIDLCLSKILFRKFQKKHNLSHPNFIEVDKTLIKKKKILFKKSVIKPNSSSGSKGIKILSIKTKPKKKLEYYKNAKIISEDSRVILEERIDGQEYGGNCCFYNSKLIDLSITKKINKNNIPISHIIPSGLDEIKIKSIRNDIIKISNLLKVKTAVFNFDLKIKNKKNYFLDFSLRNGGNGLTEIILKKKGFDYEKFIYGKIITIKKKIDNNYYCSYLIGTRKKKKKFKSIKIKSNNSILSKIIFKKKNDLINQFMSSADVIGLIIFKSKSIENVKKKIKYFNKHIKINFI